MALPLKVMFVCLGNICRSPLAQAVFDQARDEAGLEGQIQTESSGITSYHAGDPSDPRMRKTAARHGVTIDHRSRPFSVNDFDAYDLIIGMDQQNYRDLQGLARNDDDRRKIHLLREWDPQAGEPREALAGGRAPEVPDPYYGGAEGFEKVFTLVDRTARALLQDVTEGGGGFPGGFRD